MTLTSLRLASSIDPAPLHSTGAANALYPDQTLSSSP